MADVSEYSTGDNMIKDWVGPEDEEETEDSESEGEGDSEGESEE